MWDAAPLGAGGGRPLTQKQLRQYCDDGYCIARDVLTPGEVQILRDEAAAICRGERGFFEGLDVGGALPRSGAAEPKRGVEIGGATALVLGRHYCIHFPHKLSPTIVEFMARHSTINAALTQLIGPNVKAVQSMLFIKGPGMPGQPWHQDERYLPTRDRSLTGTWIPLDDTTAANGTLQVWPGSHRRGVVFPVMEHGRLDGFYDAQSMAYLHGYNDNDAVSLELSAGSCLFFSGYLLHRSTPNRADSGSFRRVLSCHYMSCESMLPGPQDGHILDNRDVLICSGVDPYAYKGIENRNAPFSRPLQEKHRAWCPQPNLMAPNGHPSTSLPTDGSPDEGWQAAAVTNSMAADDDGWDLVD